MLSRFSLLLCAAAVAALTACTLGAPVPDQAGEVSGEEEVETSGLLSLWKALADRASEHKTQFRNEFRNDVATLDNYKSPLFPPACLGATLSKEACFQRLAKGLLVYMVFLKYVEKEYPNNTVSAEAKSHSEVLIQLIKKKMRHGDQVSALSSSQEEELLKEYNRPKDSFSRKMAAHSILDHFRMFLVDGKRAIYKWEKARRNTQPIFHTIS